MILVGTFVFGVLVGCFIERRRLGISWKSSDCYHPTKNYQISCVCCQKDVKKQLYNRHKISSSRQKQLYSSRSRVSFAPTKNRLFIPRAVRREMSPFRRPRSRSSSTKRSVRHYNRPSLSVTNLTRNYYTEPLNIQHKIEPSRSAVNITNVVSDSSRQPSKRWTEGMLYRRPQGHLRPRSLGRIRHPGSNIPRYY